ncbi:class II glutamine amidotransferase [Hellea sp.]|nr:class II glutamine amidotransferase [Hellea sp.]
MCELFAMSSKEPTHVNYSLNEFAKHGGLTYHNKSGWGIAYFEDRDLFLVKEPTPAHDSPLAHYISQAGRKSHCVIAHVRLATIGEPTMRNTHPFRRALGGHMHAFAHNGTLDGIHDDYPLDKLNYTPIGETDSELGFCVLLEALRPLWVGGADKPPSVEDRLSVFAKFASEQRQRGSSNFLYSDGDVLFAHAHKRVYEEFGLDSDPRPPGLSIKRCMSREDKADYKTGGLNVGGGDQMTALLASVPLDSDGWEPLPEGVAIALQAGAEVGRIPT